MLYPFLVVGLCCGVDSPAYEFLKEKGLKALGGYYVLSEENDLGKGLTEIKGAERALSLASKAHKQFEAELAAAKASVENMLAENKRLRAEYDRTTDVTAGNRLVNRINSNVEETNRIQAKLNDESNGKEVRAKFAKAREEYMNKLLSLRAIATRAKEKYAEFAKNEEIAKKIEMANQETEKEYELGPSRLFVRNEQALEKLESKIQSDTLQLRKVSNTFEIDVSLNGKVTKSMVFDTGASSISLPFGVGAELGLKTGPDDVKVRVSLADGRVVIGTRKTLDSVRVGKFEVKNVECLVLPPELTEAPLLLGGTFLNQFNYKMDPVTGKLTLGKIDDESETPGKPTKAKAKPKKPSKST